MQPFISKPVQVHTDPYKFHARNPVVTIGTFDGIHLGHQQVIARLKEIARKEDGETVVFTFYPHPRLVTSPEEQNLRLLTTLEEKKKLFSDLGIGHLMVFPFTAAFSKMKYHDFVRSVLVDTMKISHLVIGYDHKFGHNRDGGFEYLQECAQSLNFRISQLDVLDKHSVNVSSTRIRKAIEEGNMELANDFLGYCYMLSGRVVKGNQIGRTMGFPTANIEVFDKHKLVPGTGVYAIHALLDGQQHNGMLNIGYRPTINSNMDHRSIETHIFGVEKDLYNKAIEIRFVKKIRDEQKFDSLNQLQEQLHHDKRTIFKVLKI